MFALLLGVFFSPLVRYDATFSTVANFQRLLYPWAGGAPVDRPEAPFRPQSDHATYVHPRQTFVDREVKQNHEIPLWDPLSLAGTAFFAENGSRLAYPPFVALTLLFRPSWAHDLYVILHLFAAGMAAFALVRHLGARFSGALLGGTAWMLSSYALGWIMLELFAAVAVMLPLALLFVRRWHERSSWLDLAMATLFLGFLVLGSSVDVGLFGFVAVVGYAGMAAAARLVRGWGLGVRHRLALLAGPAVLTVGALAIAAPAILPFLELSGRSLRVAVPRELRTTVGPARLVRSFLPPAIPTDFGQAWNALNTDLVFAGTVTAGLALAGLLLRRPGAALGRGLVVGSFLFFGFTAVQNAVGFFIPALGQLSAPGRGLFVWILGLAVLGGLGLDHLLERIRALPGRGGPRSRDRAAVRRRHAVTGLVAMACLAVTSFQLLTFGRRVNPPFQRRTASQLFPVTPAVQAIRAELGEGPGRGRVMGLSLPGGEALVASTAMAVDLPTTNGYENFVPANVSTLWRAMNGEAPEAASSPTYVTFLPRFVPDTVRTDLLGRVGVAAVMGPPAPFLAASWSPATIARRGLRPVYSGPDGTVFAVADRVPRALVVGEAEWTGSDDDALRRFLDPSLDVRRTVVLQGSPPPMSPSAAQGDRRAVPSSVTWLKDGANQLRLAVTAADEAWLVVLDTWDPDWLATVDGRRVEVLRANFGFRAVRVPPGTSTVTFTYRPTMALVGASVSMTASTALVAGVVLRRARSRRRAYVLGTTNSRTDSTT